MPSRTTRKSKAPASEGGRCNVAATSEAKLGVVVLLDPNPHPQDQWVRHPRHPNTRVTLQVGEFLEDFGAAAGADAGGSGVDHFLEVV
jgi:hypothetical protein